MNPLEKAVMSATKTNTLIGNLLAKIGNSEHPRGFVEASYRNAKLAMTSALKEPEPLQPASIVLDQLRRTVELETRVLLRDAQVTGVEEATRQLGYYGVQTKPPSESVLFMELTSQSDSALSAVMTRLDAQIANAKALMVTGAEDEQILGNDGRPGVLRASDTVASVGFWATAILWDSFSWWTGRSGTNFQKQAVAALDYRTTDCCTRVHGQIQPFNKPFHLTGTPRFADYIDWPAFHYHCRTSVALYESSWDLGLTEQMLEDASLFI